MRAIALLALAGTTLFAAGNGNSETAHAAVRVTIMAPVKLISNSDLNFGTIVVDDLNEASGVTMVSDAGAVIMKDWSKCAAYTKTTQPSAAVFHYQKDKSVDVNIAIDPIVNLTGGVKLTTNNDLPVDNCTIFNNPTGVESKHFTVAGKLEIPKGAIGYHSGLVNVTVSYK